MPLASRVSMLYLSRPRGSLKGHHPAATCYHRCDGLNPHGFKILQLWRPETQTAYHWTKAQVLVGLHSLGGGGVQGTGWVGPMEPPHFCVKVLSSICRQKTSQVPASLFALKEPLIERVDLDNLHVSEIRL